MKDRAKREAFLVTDQESIEAKDENLGSSEGEEGSGREGDKGIFARLVSVESKEEEEGSGTDYLADDPLLGNLSKRAINLSDLEAGGHQQRKMLGLQSLGERLLWDLSTYWCQLVLYLFLSFFLDFLLLKVSQ